MTSIDEARIEAEPTWADRLNPRNWSLTWKLVVVGLVPALLALTLGVLRVIDQADTAAELGRSTDLIEVRDQVAGAANALRQERDESTLFVAVNRTGDRAVLETGFGRTDGELDAMLGELRGSGTLDPATGSALQQAEGWLTQLRLLRSDALSNTDVASDQVLARYGDVVGGMDVLDRALLRQLRTPGTAGLADALTAVTSALEQLSVEHTVLGAAIRSSRMLPGDAATLSATTNQLRADYREYQVAVTPEQVERFGSFLDDAADDERERLKGVITGSPPPITLPPNEWDAAYAGSRAAAERSGELIRAELGATSAAAEDRAGDLAGINSVVLLIGLLIGITIAVVVARALIRSLRVLRTSALDVAERRLPEAVESMRAGGSPDITVDPVPLSGRDEVGQVARAFDAVHGQAVRLAADQAALQAGVSAMFVNLSRRSQALVERQLQLIEQLESNEEDSDQLANLFHLDHLATRMRRNSENLLVLAGTDSAKRNIAPVPIVDVLRAAVSEIEQYQRIVVQAPPTVAVLGRAASDVVHLLAELLDNATNFSPPDSQVVMTTARTTDGSVVVEIADRGVGMADHDLHEANERLSGPLSVDVSVSRRMGLFVVGRLGARHRVEVRLSSSTGAGPRSGLTASVTVPAQLIHTAAGDTGRPTGAPARPAPVSGVPPQRGSVNGTGRTGLPAAQVSGTADPDQPSDRRASGDRAAPFTPAPTGSHATNGSGPGLPVRRPGSTLRADPTGPNGQPVPAPTDTGPGGTPEPVAGSPDGSAVGDPRRNGAPITGDPAPDPAEQEQGGTVRTPAGPVDGPAAEGSDGRPADGRPAGVEDPAGAVAGPARPPAPRPAAPMPSGSSVREPGAAAPRQDAAALPRRRPGTSRPVPSADHPAGSPGAGVGNDEAPATVRGDAAPDGDTRNGDTRNGDRAPVDRPRHDLRPDRVPDGVAGNGHPTGDHADDGALPGGRPQNGQLPRADPERDGLPLDAAPPPARPEPVLAAAAPDELFGSRSPELDDPALPESGPPAGDVDLTETTPIFAEIASAWFRSNRPVPVTYPEPADAAGAPAAHPAGPSAPPPARAPFAAPAPAAAPTPFAAEPARRPAEPERVRAGQGAGRDFSTVADEGWRAADNLAGDRGDELTAAGLPKRRPRARLVPGNAGAAVLAPATAPVRSAESIRGRLASYQQGVRLGRENRTRDGAGSTPAANGGTQPADARGNHDEESP